MSSLGISGGGWVARTGAPALFAFLAVLVVVPLALTSPIAAAFLIAVLALVALALIFGASVVGAAMVVLGFGMVVFDNVHLSGSVKLADPFFVAGFMLLLPRLVTSSGRPPNAFTLGAVGLVVIGLLSVAVSPQPSSNIGYFFSVVRGVVLFPLVLSRWQPRLREVVAAAFAYLVGSSVNVVAALINGANFGDRYSGLSSHPNVMAYGQALSLALVPFLVRTMPRKVRWLVLVLAGVSVYGIWISGSRGALLCAGTLVVFYPVLTRSIPAALGVVALAAPAIVMVSNASQDHGPSNALGRLLGDSSGAASDQARTSGAQFGFDQFLGHPFLGDGWLTIWGVHVAYIQVAAAIGIFGLAFYFILLSSVVRPLVAVPTPYNLLAVPALAAVLLDLVLPVIGALFEWSVIGLALMAAPLAAQAKLDREVPLMVEGR